MVFVSAGCLTFKLRYKSLLYKNLALKLLTGKLKEPQPCGTHFKSWINTEGLSSLPFICIGNRCFKRDLLFHCNCSVFSPLGLDHLCGKRTALAHPAGLWLYTSGLQQGGGIKAEGNRFSDVSPVYFSCFLQRNKKEQIEKKKGLHQTKIGNLFQSLTWNLTQRNGE